MQKLTRIFLVKSQEPGVIIRGKDWLEGRLKLPGDDVRPVDVLEEGVRLDGIGVRGTAAQTLGDIKLRKSIVMFFFSFYLLQFTRY